MDVGGLQAGAPATVTNLTNTDTRGGSDNTRRHHQVKSCSPELDGLISSLPPPPFFGASIPRYLLVFDYLQRFEETTQQAHERAPP